MIVTIHQITNITHVHMYVRTKYAPTIIYRNVYLENGVQMCVHIALK